MAKNAKRPKHKTRRTRARNKGRQTKGASGLTDREAAFKFWCECQNVRKTATQFGVSHTTIYRIMAADNWKARRDDIIAQVRQDSANDVAKTITDNLESAREIHRLVVHELKAKLESHEYTPTVRDAIIIKRYIDEYEGTAPGVVSAELLNDVIGDLLNGSEDEAERIVVNSLAGIGVTDRAAVERAKQIWLGRLRSPDGER